MHKKQLAITATLVGGMVFAGVAGATPYVVTLTQQGTNVVATGSGNIDLTDLHFDLAVGNFPNLHPAGFELIIGNSYRGFALFTGTIFSGHVSGPGNFGSGDITIASSATGDAVGVLPGGVLPSDIGVPFGYTSDTALSSSATFDNATFASLGVRPGTYAETWGTGADQRITLDIIPSAVGVPEPAELGLFGLGLGLIGGFAGLRRRKA